MPHYRIRVRGHLDPQWKEWFDPSASSGLTIEPLPDGQSLLTTAPIDQAALHGLLSRVRDLNLTLVSVERQEIDGPEKPSSSEGTH